MANEEFILRLSTIQQQAEKLEEQINAINQQLQELGELKSSLGKLDEEEILANIGKGIFVKARITSKDLYVNVGGKAVVKKNIPETQELIQKQMLRLEEIKVSLLDEIQEANHQLQQLVQEAQSHKN